MKRILLVIALLASHLAAAAQVVPNTATITFTAVTTRADGVPVTGAISYNVYQGINPGTAKTKVGTISATTQVISSGLLSNTNYCWQVTVMEAPSTAESAKSNEACKQFAASPPNTVVITVQ